MNLPKILYRTFSKEIYALDFINNGRFRLGLIDHYAKIEDEKRIDQTEGESSSYVKTTVQDVTINQAKSEISLVEDKSGYLHVRGSRVNPLYLLCTSGKEVDLDFLREMGGFVVRVNDPTALLNDIENAEPINSKMEKRGKCIIEKVLYTKGQIENFDPDSIDAVKRSYTQKPPSFKNECEYRFIVTTIPLLGEDADKFLFYNLNRKLEYLEII